MSKENALEETNLNSPLGVRGLKVISRKSPLALLQVKEVFDFFPNL